MKIKRKFLVLFMVLFTICSFIGIKAIAISNEGKVIVNKTSVKDDEVYGRSAKVNLEVSGIKKEINQEIEIVFVPNTMNYEDKTAVKVTSTYLYDYILTNIQKIDNQEDLYNNLINEMEQSENNQ